MKKIRYPSPPLPQVYSGLKRCYTRARSTRARNQHFNDAQIKCSLQLRQGKPSFREELPPREPSGLPPSPPERSCGANIRNRKAFKLQKNKNMHKKDFVEEKRTMKPKTRNTEPSPSSESIKSKNTTQHYEDNRRIAPDSTER